MKTYEFTVPEICANERLDIFLAEKAGITRNAAQKIIERGDAFVNGKAVKASFKLKTDDNVRAEIEAPVMPDIKAEDIPLDILFEDGDIIVINKPKNMVVHPSAGHYGGTLVNALMHHAGGELSGINGVLRPGIVHRLDKDTTGILLIAKNDFTHSFLSEKLKSHEIERVYEAIAINVIKEDDFTIDKPVKRHKTDRKKMDTAFDGKNAVTHIHVIERFKTLTYLRAALETGRTHQIRVHLKSIGHPVLGDLTYGFKKSGFSLDSQALHAKKIAFDHPRTGEYLEFNAPLPDYFEKILKAQRNR